MPFQYKRILLIGATSGIGKALAERFIKEGSHVIVVGRRKESLKELVEKHGHEAATAVPFDITETEKIPALVQNVTSTYPDLDCVFLNSGIQRGSNFSQPDSVHLDDYAKELLTNYTSFVHLTHALLPFLLAQDHETSLIYTTSVLAIVPLVRCPGYSASKAALHAFILCLRAQLAESKVKVMELLPPAVQTELHDTKHQPDIEDGRSIGMPLDEFTDAAFEGLAQGKEMHIVGPFRESVSEAEEKRQAIYRKLNCIGV